MYTPSAFKDEDLNRLHQHIADTRLAVLVTQGEQGLQATHVPLLLDPEQRAMMTMTMDPTIQGSGHPMLSAQRAPNAPTAGVARKRGGTRRSCMIHLWLLGLGFA